MGVTGKLFRDVEEVKKVENGGVFISFDYVLGIVVGIENIEVREIFCFGKVDFFAGVDS